MSRGFFFASLLLAVELGVTKSAHGDEVPGTKPIAWEEADLSTRLIDGAHQFVERKIAEARDRRRQYWARDFSSLDAYATSVAPNRERFKTIIGVVDPRLPPSMERYGDDEAPALVAESRLFQVHQVRWPVLEGVWGLGLLLQPTSEVLGHIVCVPDAGQSPEALVGLVNGQSSEVPVARWLAENGFEVIVPVTLSRDKLRTDEERLRTSDQTYREWIYRQAFHMGRHPIGYEVQTVLAAVDWMISRHGSQVKIGVCGWAEGGQTAIYAAAVDPRISATLASGYFDSRERVWSEPIYRNVWSLLREFGDAEIASLITPRELIIEACPVPKIVGHKGDWQTPDFASVMAEFERIPTGQAIQQPKLFRSNAGEFTIESVTAFVNSLGVRNLSSIALEPLPDRRKVFSAEIRHAQYFHDLEHHVQRLIHRSEHVRDKAFLFSVMPELANGMWSTDRQHVTHTANKFIEGSKRFREQFRTEAMGEFEERVIAANPRSRFVAESDNWKAYDVVLDVYPEFFAWGLLIIPKDLKPGQRRPAVVVQHGRNGIPRDMLDTNSTAYGNIGAKLAEQGFVVFAPHNLYRGEDRYRWLSRKANTVKGTLFSFIVASHEQILSWLSEQPFVDGKRIAFYGLSYGGETAVRVPPLVDKYCLSICSGDFNQWTRKVAATDQSFSFMRTIEWEMPYWNLGHTFDYAEMAYLMVPRPFMVERGHNDQVGRDQWVAHEYAKVKWLYAQLGLGRLTEIEYFQGGHSMRAEGTVRFLHRHLNWPESRVVPDP